MKFIQDARKKIVKEYFNIFTYFILFYFLFSFILLYFLFSFILFYLILLY